MKKYIAVIMIMMLAGIASIVSAADAEAFTVERLVVAGSIDEREPVGVVDTFAASTEKVYCFLEARDISADTTVSFVWYFGAIETARVELPVREGPRWRTWSSKTLYGNSGVWKVELQDATGNVLDTVTFMVE